MGMHSFRAGKDLEKELDYIKRTLGTTASQAIVESVHAFYQNLKRKKQNKKSLVDVFENLGLIGMVSAEEEDLSESYKKKLSESMKEKYHDGE